MARSEGFTLLELLVVLVVLSTLAVLAFGYEREALARMEVESAARRVLLGIERGRLTWLERRQEEERELGVSRQPYCLVVGGGQGGLALGARLRRLGVPTIEIGRAHV